MCGLDKTPLSLILGEGYVMESTLGALLPALFLDCALLAAKAVYESLEGGLVGLHVQIMLSDLERLLVIHEPVEALGETDARLPEIGVQGDRFAEGGLCILEV